MLKITDLNKINDMYDFSNIEINTLISFNTYDFDNINMFDMQLQHINNIAFNKNAELVVYHMSTNEILNNNGYLLKFKAKNTNNNI